MATVTLLEVGAAIRETLAVDAALAHVFAPDELKEGIADDATVQVYPESGMTDVSGGTDRMTFGAAGVTPKRWVEQVWNIDVYARQRRHIGEDLAALLPLIDAVQGRLAAQDGPPYFGLVDGTGNDAIKSFNWNWRRVIFRYGDPEKSYVGAQCALTLNFY